MAHLFIPYIISLLVICKCEKSLNKPVTPIHIKVDHFDLSNNDKWTTNYKNNEIISCNTDLESLCIYQNTHKYSKLILFYNNTLYDFFNDNHWNEINEINNVTNNEYTNKLLDKRRRLRRRSRRKSKRKRKRKKRRKKKRSFIEYIKHNMKQIKKERARKCKKKWCRRKCFMMRCGGANGRPVMTGGICGMPCMGGMGVGMGAVPGLNGMESLGGMGMGGM
eukprot:441165_1